MIDEKEHIKRYDCCTHYKTHEYKKGRIFKMLPVKICCNCGEVQTDFTHKWQDVLFYILLPFWNGKIEVEE